MSPLLFEISGMNRMCVELVARQSAQDRAPVIDTWANAAFLAVPL